MIASGRVAVNGAVVTVPGTKADPENDLITVDGRPVEPLQQRLYVLLNKPVGYASTRSDPHAQHTVIELLRDLKDSYLYPVGRLDTDTSGLLLLTNDGDFAHLVTHPSHRIDRTYLAVVRGRIKASALNQLARGIELDDGLTAPAVVRLISSSAGTNTSTVEVTIHEGRKRQVRRMFAAVGHPVSRLSRIRLGNLDLKAVKEGEFRYLTAREVSQLRKLAATAQTGSGSARGRR